MIPNYKAELLEEQYKNIAIIKPIRGYYNILIATLDFHPKLG